MVNTKVEKLFEILEHLDNAQGLCQKSWADNKNRLLQIYSDIQKAANEVNALIETDKAD